MDIRLQTENNEKIILSKYATHSNKTLGRNIEEKKCDVRTDFQRDRDRIIHSKAFRRLKGKTQVFIAPEGDHFRTRLTHTLEVSQIARTIARALNLNEDLTEAISLGHDLGHTPFGHTGEYVLNSLHKNGFKHNEESLKIVEYIESRNGKRGLNLTYEVRDGILNHTGTKDPLTLEGQIVKISDRIAYINHDIDDSIRANIITKEDLPKDSILTLGKSHGERINNMIIDIIKNTDLSKKISMSSEFKFHTDKLRSFMFKNVYLNNKAKSEEDKAKNILKQLYYYYLEYFDKIPEEYKEINGDNEDIVCHYIAGMTDTYVIKLYNKLFVPSPFSFR